MPLQGFLASKSLTEALWTLKSLFEALLMLKSPTEALLTLKSLIEALLTLKSLIEALLTLKPPDSDVLSKGNTLRRLTSPRRVSSSPRFPAPRRRDPGAIESAPAGR